MGIASFVMYAAPESGRDGIRRTRHIVLALMTLLSEIAALGLGIAGALQRRCNRLSALLGVACSVLALVAAFTQNAIYLSLHARSRREPSTNLFLWQPERFILRDAEAH
jgi:hypothetical protein